jgi:hypothetical protein
MRTKVALALSVSFLLILGAGWHRFAPAGEAKGTLVSVDTQDEPPQIDPAVFAASTTTPEVALTTTDMVSRQLFSSYLSLAAKGQATPENVDLLAQGYAESIASLNSANTVSAVDLNVVSNSRENVEHYDDAVGDIYTKYQALLDREFSKAELLGESGPEISAFGARVGALYAEEAAKMQAVPTPAMVLKDHLALVNSYLKTAASYKALAKTESNTVEAMAGIYMARANLDVEAQLIANLQKTLLSSGIISGNQ